MKLGAKAGRMGEPSIFQTLRETGCDLLLVSCGEVVLAKSVTSKIIECMKGKRRRFPLVFVTTYPGEGKGLKAGVSVLVDRMKGSKFYINMRWFITHLEPPDTVGNARELFECLRPTFGEREVAVSATFSYDTERVGSLFRPIQVAEGSTIFDEIVGFSGTKRDHEGKLLYTLDVELGQKKLVHVVHFKQTVKLGEDLPLILIPSAKRISALALEKRGTLEAARS